jgi:hypothetical protein
MFGRFHARLILQKAAISVLCVSVVRLLPVAGGRRHGRACPAGVNTSPLNAATLQFLPDQLVRGQWFSRMLEIAVKQLLMQLNLASALAGAKAFITAGFSSWSAHTAWWFVGISNEVFSTRLSWRARTPSNPSPIRLGLSLRLISPPA